MMIFLEANAAIQHNLHHNFAAQFKKIYRMALNIKTVKISFSRIGITTSNTPRRVCYIPMATIKYMNTKRKQKQVYLTGDTLGEIGSSVISKQTFLGLIIGGSFFAVLCKDNLYHFFNEEGEHITSREIIGVPVQVGEDDFIIRNGDILTMYSATGEMLKWRQLTEEEKEQLKENDQ